MKVAQKTALRGTLLFHLNLNYSSIEVRDRAAVVERCYRPLLELLEGRPWLRVAIEASAHTLERIERLAPDWITGLAALVAEGRVEFLGSGDTQLIGPLVPASVNRWNQELGVQSYRRLLGRAPSVALVNEMAWSQGLVDAYLDAGYRALVMEWNNPRRAHPAWKDEWRFRPAKTRSPTGRSIEILWADAVLFQRFQRVIAGDIEPDEYVRGVLGLAAETPRHVFLYSSDAEVFDYRPGRYAAEPVLRGRGEWQRMATLLERLHEDGVELTTPSAAAAADGLRRRELQLSDAADPIPVKKQPKYNVTRWALSGWNDVGLNARCFARARELERDGGAPRDWQLLCRAWGSDLRTHLTHRRWERLQRALPAAVPEPPAALPCGRLQTAEVRRDGQRLAVDTGGVRAVLLTRRGLALESLSFCAVSPHPLLGTLFMGHFEPIEYSADFYTGHTVLEEPAHRRVTDLVAVEPEVERRPDALVVSARVPTALGPLAKSLTFRGDRLEIRYGFSGWGERPLASLRTGVLTLLDQAWGEALFLTCANGGARERFRLHEGCDHGRSVSPLVSAAAAFGATDGTLSIDDGRLGVEVSWPQDEAAALPMITFQSVRGKRFVRLAFSLSEVDETHRPGAPLPDFRLTLRPYRNRR